MKLNIQFLCLFIGICIISCSNDSSSPTNTTGEQSYTFLQSQKIRIANPGTTDNELQQAIRGNDQFAFDLLQNLSSSGSDANTFFSPYSISTAFSMTYAGARANTQTEMSTVFHFPTDQYVQHKSFNAIDNELDRLSSIYNQLSIENSIWAQSNYVFKESFLDIMSQHYSAGIFQLNFHSGDDDNRIIINKWVKEKTYDLIPELLPKGSIDANTALVLVNAICLKALWQHPFDKRLTSKQLFVTNNGFTKNIDFMSLKEPADFLINKSDSLVTIELPYKESTLAMDIFMPVNKSLSTFISSLSFDSYNDIIKSLKPDNVSIKLPKFSLKPDLIELRDILISMGMHDAFSDKADFSGMIENHKLSISDAYHKAFLDVFESGTIAAAATAVVMVDSAAYISNEIRIDHPFIICIRDTKTGAILFMGSVNDPSL